jgi:hypothetical protein
MTKWLQSTSRYHMGIYLEQPIIKPKIESGTEYKSTDTSNRWVYNSVNFIALTSQKATFY